MLMLSVALVPMYYIRVPRTFSTDPEGRLENLFYAFKEISETPTIAVALCGTIIRSADTVTH